MVYKLLISLFLMIFTIIRIKYNGPNNSIDLIYQKKVCFVLFGELKNLIF